MSTTINYPLGGLYVIFGILVLYLIKRRYDYIFITEKDKIKKLALALKANDVIIV